MANLTTKTLLTEWKNFINEENNIYEDKDEIYKLIEFGDKLEEVLNESIDFKLLESHLLEEGVISAFRAAKDKVKDFLTQGWTKDKVDKDGNIVKQNPDDEESQAVQEYTTKTKALITLLLITKFAAIAASSLGGGHVTTTDLAQAQLKNMPGFEHVNVTPQDIKSATSIKSDKIKIIMGDIEVDDNAPLDVNDIGDSDSTPDIQQLKFNKPIVINVNGIKKAAKETAYDKLKDIIDPTGENHENLKEKINSLDYGADGTLIAHGIDAKKPGAEVNVRDTSSTNDIEVAVKHLSDIVDSSDLSDVKTGNQIKAALQGFDLDQTNQKISSMSAEQKTKLLNAAKIYALKQLKNKKPKAFNAKTYTGHFHTAEGGSGSGDDFSESSQGASGSKDARILGTMMKSLSHVSIKDIKDVSGLESELAGHFSSHNVNARNDASSLGSQIVQDIMTFIFANAGNDMPNLKNIDKATAPLIKHTIKSNINRVSK